MDARRTDRIWLIGGIVAIVILITAAWLLAVSPKFAQADSVQVEADDAGMQLTRLKKEVATLKEQTEKKATYQVQLDALVKHLPETWGMPVFLRSLQDSGSTAGVTVTDLSVGAAVVSAKVPSAIEMPISLTASGTVPELSKFIARLQQTQSRAVVVNAVTVSGEGTEVSANLTLTAFCTTSDLADSSKTDRTDLCATS